MGFCRFMAVCVFSICLPSLVYGGLGFYKSLPNLPKVDAKKSAVFQGYFPAPPVMTFPAGTFSEFDPDHVFSQETLGEDWTKNPSLILARRQMEECLKTPDEDCHFLSSYAFGSLFFSGDEKTIYTAFHNVSGLVSGKMQIQVPNQEHAANLLVLRSSADPKDVDPYSMPNLMKFYKKVRVQSERIVLVNAQNEVVYGLNEEDTYDAIDFPPENLYAVYGVDILRNYRDFAKIKINRPIGRPLPISSKPAYSEPVYLSGFPATADRAHHEKPSADNMEFRFTKGVLLDQERIHEKMEILGFNFSASQLESDEYLKKSSFCDCDGQSGISGGPAFNGQGEVEFIATDVLPVDFDTITPENILSFGPRMTHVLKSFTEMDKKLEQLGDSVQVDAYDLTAPNAIDVVSGL